jgi:hypothetical protein
VRRIYSTSCVWVCSDATQNAEDRLNKERRLDQCPVEKMCQIIKLPLRSQLRFALEQRRKQLATSPHATKIFSSMRLVFSSLCLDRPQQTWSGREGSILIDHRRASDKRTAVNQSGARYSKSANERLGTAAKAAAVHCCIKPLERETCRNLQLARRVIESAVVCKTCLTEV